jgi:hypothetical protein
VVCRRKMRRLLVVLLFALAACGGTKREASAVVGAIDRYRDADNDHRPEKADLLDAVPCSDAEVCAAKTACMKAADPTAKGLRLKREVEKGLADVQAGKLSPQDPAAQAMPGKLDDSQRLMDEGQKALDQCDQLATALRIKYGL